MGYRSDVRCLIYGEPDKITALKAESQLTGSTAWEIFKDNITCYDVMRSVCVDTENSTPRREYQLCSVIDMSGEGWKWYDGYDQIKPWNALLDLADERELDHEFVRVGEEVGDIEEEYSEEAENWLGAETRIRDDIPDKIGGKSR